MRTHEGRVPSDVRPGVNAGNTAAGRVPAQQAPAERAGPAGNVRVAPATRRARRGGGQDQAAVPSGATGPGEAPGLHWDCDAAAADDGADGRDGTGATPPRRPGRPRSERAEQAILDAAIEAVGEVGIEGVRCEDVAARAGVGKATLYRRWPGKEDLLIAAFASLRHPLPEPRGASVRDDLVALLTAIAADADDPRYFQQYALLQGAGERYPRLVARYKEEVIEPRRELVRSVLRRGVAAGELRADLDVDVAMLMLTGAVMARGKHDPAPAAPGFVKRAVDDLLTGIAARAHP